MPRTPQLDGLRAVAIAAVILHHLFRIPLLWGGVDLFFVLSGFLITGILVNEKPTSLSSYLRRFYARRARRILPAYAVILLLTALVFGAGYLHYWPFYLGAMNFLKPLHLPTPDTLPLWSLAVEEQFYLLWPFAIFFLQRRALPWLAGSLLILAPILRYTCTPLFTLHWAVYQLLPFRMDTLAAGALMALLWPRLAAALTPALRYKAVASAAAAVAVAVFSLRWLGRHGETTSVNTPLANFAVYECVLLLAAAALLLTLLGFGAPLLAAKPLTWIGRISYSMYLVHLGIIALLTPRHWLLCLVATVAYAALLWFALEAPILRAGRKPPSALLST